MIFLGLLTIVGILKNNRVPARVFTYAVDVQATLGIILLIDSVLSGKVSRFFLFEHPVIMLLALFLLHFGLIRSKDGSSIWKTTTVVGFVLILLGIPWWRPLVRLP